MMSKFLRLSQQLRPAVLNTGKKTGRRVYSDFIPPNQYDLPIPYPKFHFPAVLAVYWEIIPLVTCTAFAMFIMFASIISACRNKVDVVFTANNRRNLSRTMDLRNPTVHKLIIINQRYEPWPEMQDVLDKMQNAEKRALTRAATCSFAVNSNKVPC